MDGPNEAFHCIRRLVHVTVPRATEKWGHPGLRKPDQIFGKNEPFSTLKQHAHTQAHCQLEAYEARQLLSP